MPPQKSGIAKYAETMILKLQQHFEIRLFSSRQIGESVNYASFKNWEQANTDFRILTLGNSHFHAACFELAALTPALILGHDVRITNLTQALGLSNYPKKCPKDLSTKELHWLPTHGYEYFYKYANSFVFHDPELALRVGEESKLKSEFIPFMAQRIPSQQIKIKNLNGPIKIGILGDSDLHEKMLSLLLEISEWLDLYNFEHTFIVIGDLNPIVKAKLISDFSNKSGKSGIEFTGYLNEGKYLTFLNSIDLGLQLRRNSFLTLSGAASDLAISGVPSVVPQKMIDAMNLPEFFYGLPEDVSPPIIAKRILDASLHPQEALMDQISAYYSRTNNQKYADRLAEIIQK